MMTRRTSASRFPAISMPTRTPTRKQMAPKTIWRFVIGTLLSDSHAGDRPASDTLTAGDATPQAYLILPWKTSVLAKNSGLIKSTIEEVFFFSVCYDGQV